MRWFDRWRRPTRSERFLSPPEIVQDLRRNLPPTTLAEIVALDASQLIAGHHGIGRWIRNHYRLWDRGNPHGAGHPDAARVEGGLAVSSHHPDQVSGRVLEGLWGLLRAEGYPPTDYNAVERSLESFREATSLVRASSDPRRS